MDFYNKLIDLMQIQEQSELKIYSLASIIFQF